MFELCYCENRKQCLICIIKRIHTAYEYNLCKNMFDLDFLIICYSDLYHYLNQLFKTKKHCFKLKNEYHYVWEDWFDGKNYRVWLQGTVKNKEEHNINKIKK